MTYSIHSPFSANGDFPTACRGDSALAGNYTASPSQPGSLRMLVTVQLLSSPRAAQVDHLSPESRIGVACTFRAKKSYFVEAAKRSSVARDDSTSWTRQERRPKCSISDRCFLSRKVQFRRYIILRFLAIVSRFETLLFSWPPAVFCINLRYSSCFLAP